MEYKKLKEINYDINLVKGKYYNSKSIKEREECLNQISNSINYLKNCLSSSNFPDYMKNQTINNIKSYEKDLHTMTKNVKKIPVVENAGNNGNKNKNEDDDWAKGIENTIVSEKTNVKWDDVAGLKEAKESLYETLIMPINFPDFFKGNVQPWKGILLYGPPGTGKTFLAKAAANECNSTFFSVSSSDLISKFMGESEKMIKQLFKLANEKAPSIIFIDEIDSMCGTRGDGENESSRRVKTEFLVRMQGLGSNNDRVLILGATNIPWGLDKAILRRFEKRIYIELPDREARIICLKNKLKGLEHDITQNQFSKIAGKLNYFSGADIEILVKDAVMEPVRRAQNAKRFKVVNKNGRKYYLPVQDNWNKGEFINNTLYNLPDNSLVVDNVCYNDFKESLKRCKPSVGNKDLKQFKDWTKEYGIGGE